jgi:hypothetical protein
MVFMLTSGERNEMVAFEALMEHGKVKRVGRGRLRVRPDRVCADKGYANGRVRGYLRHKGIRE